MSYPIRNFAVLCSLLVFLSACAKGPSSTAPVTADSNLAQSLMSALTAKAQTTTGGSTSSPTVTIGTGGTTAATQSTISGGGDTGYIPPSGGDSGGSTGVIHGPLVSLAVTPNPVSLAKGLTQQFKATGMYADGTTADFTTSASWGSGAPGTASVNASGLATAIATGTTTITATSSSITGSASLTVTAPSLASLTVSPASASIAKGLTLPFTATGTMSDGSTKDYTTSVTWVSGTTAVALINASGVATGTGVGSATITATSGAISGNATLTVTAAQLVSLAVTPNPVSIAKGLTQQFTATGTMTDGTAKDYTASATWSSSATSVATISNSGMATTQTVGSSVIAAAVGTVTGTASLAVTGPALVSLAVTPATVSVAAGLTKQFTATGTMTDGSTKDYTATAAWTSGLTIVAAVNAAGLATAVAAGSATISAAVGAISGNATLTVTAPELVSLAVTPARASVALGLTQPFTATGTMTDGSAKDYTAIAAWASSAPTVATINGAGLATTVARGATTVSATVGAISGSATLVVTAPQIVLITVAPPSATVTAGLTQAFTATASYTDQSVQVLTSGVTWSSSIPAVATIATTGIATGLAAGQATITASQNGLSGSASLTVTAPQLVSLAVTPVSATLAVGGTAQLTATGTLTDNTTRDYTASATWASSASSVAGVSGSGLVTASAGGMTSVTATVASLTSNTAVITVATVSIANLHDKGQVQTGFLVGQSTGLAAVGVQLDGGAVQTATGTANWKLALPQGAGTWRLGTPHTIAVGQISGSRLIAPMQTINVVKGNNQDINGDGYPDVVLGDSSYHDFDGRAYVFYSHGAAGLHASTLFAANADVILTSIPNIQAEFGNAIAMDDMNGDGYADVVVGSNSYVVCIRCDAGQARIYLSQGAKGLGASIVDPGSAATVITGEGTKNSFGLNFAMGDVNGDGYADLLVADLQASGNAGRAYLFNGAARLPATIAAATASTIFNGNGNWFGDSIAIGDVNGDGYADVAIGMPWSGKVFIYHSPGSAGFPATVATTAAHTTITGGSAEVANWFGATMVMGDLNGDGYADVVIGAPGPEEIGQSNGNWVYYNNGLGKTYVYLSPGATGFLSAVASSGASTIITGEDYTDDFGVSFAIGDFNGDGYGDLAVGADTYKDCVLRDNVILDADCQGRVYQFNSSAHGLGSTTLAAGQATTIIDGANDPGNLGISLAACDINGSGYQSLFIGGNGADGTGRVYLFDGTKSGIAGSFVESTAATTIVAGEAEANQKDTLGDAEY